MNADVSKEIKDMEVALSDLKAKETELTPISFSSEAELAQALLSGRTFQIASGYTLMYKVDKGKPPFRCRSDGGSESIPMGVVWSCYSDLQEINPQAT
jgi:hypothetical protein